MGIDQDFFFGDRLRLGGATYFWNDFEDRIVFVFTDNLAFRFGLKPDKVGKACLELEDSLWLDLGLVLEVAFTHLRVRDQEAAGNSSVGRIIVSDST